MIRFTSAIQRKCPTCCKLLTKRGVAALCARYGIAYPESYPPPEEEGANK